MKILGASLNYARTHVARDIVLYACTYKTHLDWCVTSAAITKRGPDGPPICVSGFIVTANDRWLGNGSPGLYVPPSFFVCSPFLWLPFHFLDPFSFRAEKNNLLAQTFFAQQISTVIMDSNVIYQEY